MDELVKFFSRYVELDASDIDALVTNSTVYHWPKNNVILEEGQISKEFYFLSKGLVRSSYSGDNLEKTTYFYTEEMFVSSYRSFTQGVPAEHSLITIEDTDAIAFSPANAMALTQHSSKFETLARVIMEEELAAAQDIISAFVTLNAEERYLKLLKERPILLQQIPQYHIASYLGVSPETLSRIRKRVTKS